jgi:beclin
MITCNKCLQTIPDENLDTTGEAEAMEVSLFEDMKKTEILTQMADSQDPSVLCKSCGYWLEEWYIKQITELEHEAANLDASIQSCESQLEYFEKIKIPEEPSLINEINSVIESHTEIKTQITHYIKTLETLNADYLALAQEENSSLYALLTDLDSSLEVQKRLETVNSEINFLSSTNLLFRIFSIDSNGKFGTINRMRLGRSDSVPVPWNEINAAWGQCALLLSTLFKISSTKSKIVNIYPLGPYSRISYIRDDEKRFELFFSDYNYNLIKRYNEAQNMFLEAVSELSRGIKDFGMPYLIGSRSIEGLQIAFDPIFKDRWTQALRFLLQDLNYLLHKLSD